MVPALIIGIIFFSFVLIKAAEWVIIALRRIAKMSKTGVFALSAIILALGTSFPELFVGVTSAIEKAPSLTLGVILGSNIANIALVGGLTSLIVGRIKVNGDVVNKDVITALVAGILPIFLIIDGSLGRVDGLILLAVYLAYAGGFFKDRYLEIAKEHKKENFFYRFFKRFNHIGIRLKKEYSRLFVGIALLLFSADRIVGLSKNLAEQVEVPIFVIGLVLLAIGTSLPEFAFSLKSVEDNEPSMFFGNLLGSTIANSTLIIGLTALIEPIVIEARGEYYIAAGAFFLVFSLFWYFIRTKKRLDRWEALVLLLTYLSFVIIEFSMCGGVSCT